MAKTRKRQKGSGTFKKLKCHPSLNKTSKNKNSCLDNTTLNVIKQIWNRRYPDSKINSSSPNGINNEIRKKLSSTCDNEMCWIDKTFNGKENNKIKKKLFAPKTPYSWKSNINEWLSSTDILNVMRQYEEAYPEFKFYGPAPIDFNTNLYDDKCVWPEICNINIKELKEEGKTKIGFIFNTDKHYESGSHWIAMYLDLSKKYIFFFDSNGTVQPKEIDELITNIKNQCENIGIKIKEYNNNNFRHQKSNSECGMYCLYFIINLLKNIHKHRYFNTKVIPDKRVENFRNIYFNLI